MGPSRRILDVIVVVVSIYAKQCGSSGGDHPERGHLTSAEVCVARMVLLSQPSLSQGLSSSSFIFHLLFSELRQVPDNQEVFVDVETDQSLIVELLSYQSDVPDADAAAFLFKDLAESNGVAPDAYHLNAPLHMDIASMMPKLAACCAVAGQAGVTGSVLSGEQRVSKFKEDAGNIVQIWLASVRLPSVGTDVLISLNVPVQFAPGSSSAATVHSGMIGAGGVALPAAVADAAPVLTEVLSSFVVHDWGLFAGDGSDVDV